MCRSFYRRKKQLTPDELETGETIKTPRGTFYVTDMSREQMEAAGYGFHHQSDDGKYLVMGNGTRAFAIAAEQRENPLKAAEQTTEQNENMIDGIINNTPTVDELEAKVKAGETISLLTWLTRSKPIRSAARASRKRSPLSGRSLKRIRKRHRRKPQRKQKSRFGGMSMNRFTVEETNLLSIYHEGSKAQLTENINAALPYMDADMRELAKRTLSKVDALTEEEFAELTIYAAEEV